MITPVTLQDLSSCMTFSISTEKMEKITEKTEKMKINKKKDKLSRKKHKGGGKSEVSKNLFVLVVHCEKASKCKSKMSTKTRSEQS